MSTEHILARSLDDLFDWEPPVTGAEAWIRHDYHHPEGLRASSTKRAKRFAYTTRRFCNQCNNRWMNELDDDARPHLQALARARPATFTEDAQTLLATWAYKISLGFMSREARGESSFAPRGFHRDFFNHRSLPTGMQVWLGQNTHGEIANFESWSMLLPSSCKETEPQAFSCGLSFGHGTFYFLWHGQAELRYRLRWEAHQALKQIWPPESPLTWPWTGLLPMTERSLAPVRELVENAPNGFVKDTTKRQNR